MDEETSIKAETTSDAGQADATSQKPQKQTRNESYVLNKFKKVNEKLFTFYKLQGVIPEAEWDQFEKILKVELPSSFRVQLSLPERDVLVRYMEERFFANLRDIDDPSVHLPKPLAFVPYAYQTKMPRAAVRSHPVLANLHEFLVNETTIGNISRQEAVSMVPPLLLDIKPEHIVLDACAAPGSKTMQIIELMHQQSPNPEGIVVANDLDYQRCYLLVHQTLKRMPTANCVVINQDAAEIPAIAGPDGKPVLYDRILCDVICSGDGTFRKNPELWRSWDAQKSLNLHKVQRSVAKRCAELLKVGGLMAYSTCSLNPLEDEAVVADLLQAYDGRLELVDVSKKLPQLIRVPGVSEWKVVDKNMKVCSSMDDVDGDVKRVIVPSMFPPSPEAAEKLNLQRTFRILPHSQDSGGFFVAIIKKTQPFEKEPSLNCQPLRKPTKKKRKMFREDPFVFLQDDLPALKQELTQHYGMAEDFPYENLLVRTANTEKKKGIYFVNDNLRDFLKLNGERFKVVNAGVGVLRRVDKVSACSYRLMQDGLRYVVPHISKRVLDVNVSDASLILNGYDEAHYVPLEQLESKALFHALDAGSVVLRVSNGDFSKAVCAWMGAHTVSAFVTREEKYHVLAMLGQDTSKLQQKALTTRKEKALKRATQGNGDSANGTAEKDDDGTEMQEELDETIE